MKKVLLLGDSIRIGYAPYVKEMLKNIADVIYPEENCRYTQHTYVELKKWVNLVDTPEDTSVIHWNNGHWDIAHWDGNEKSLNSVAEYCQMLERIHQRLHSYCPNANIIFALTTPMLPVKCLQENPRSTEDIIRYNQAARKLMKRLNVDVNDLFYTMQHAPASLYADHVHYADEGYKKLAAVVYDKINSYL